MAIFGHNTIGANNAGVVVNESDASRFVLGVAGDVSKLTAYLQGLSATRNIKGLIYSHNSGTGLPDALIAVSQVASATTTAGWLDLTFSSPVSLSAGTYWLGIVPDGSTDIFYDNSSGDVLEHQSGNNYASPVSTWNPGTNFPDLVMSIYATYTASGGGGATLVLPEASLGVAGRGVSMGFAINMPSES